MNRRPETEQDLADWQRTETLAEITLTPDGMRTGLLASANQMVQQFMTLDTVERPVTVTVEQGALVIARPRPVSEVAARLAADQERWDRTYAVPATEPRHTVEVLAAAGVSATEVEASWPAPAGEPMPGDTQHG